MPLSEKKRFQLVLTNTIKSHLYGSIAARLCSIPLIWRFHDILSPGFQSFPDQMHRPFREVVSEKNTGRIQRARDHLAQNGIDRGKIDVIFNSVDPELLELNKDFNDIRKEYQLEKRVKLVGCIGRIIPQKGQKVLCRPFPGSFRDIRRPFF